MHIDHAVSELGIVDRVVAYGDGMKQDRAVEAAGVQTAAVIALSAEALECVRFIDAEIAERRAGAGPSGRADHDALLEPFPVLRAERDDALRRDIDDEL